jgi:hypothetical protein
LHAWRLWCGWGREGNKSEPIRLLASVVGLGEGRREGNKSEPIILLRVAWCSKLASRSASDAAAVVSGHEVLPRERHLWRMPVNDCVQLHMALGEALKVINDFREENLRLQEDNALLLQQNHVLSSEFLSLEEEAFAERSQLAAENHILRQQNQRLQDLLQFDATAAQAHSTPVGFPRRRVFVSPNSKGNVHTGD